MDPLKIFIFFLICLAIVTCGCTGDQGVSQKNTPIITPRHTYVSPPSHISDTYLLTLVHGTDDNSVKILNGGTSSVSLMGWILDIEPENRSVILPAYSLGAGNIVTIIFEKNATTSDNEIVIDQVIRKGNLSHVVLLDGAGNQVAEL
jgi:hypothetical protein